MKLLFFLLENYIYIFLFFFYGYESWFGLSIFGRIVYWGGVMVLNLGFDERG